MYKTPSACRRTVWSLAFVFCGTSPMTAVTIDHILVSQGIQSDTNSVPLVAGRSAVVRAKIGGLESPPPNFTARLEVKSSEVILSSHSAVGGFSSTTAPDYDDEKSTIDFEVNDIGFLSLIPGSTVTFTVLLTISGRPRSKE